MICKVCKTIIGTKGFYPELREHLEKLQLCHSCDIWLSHWQRRNNQNVLRINGNQYLIVNDGTGIELTVRHNGKLKTVRAWHQGMVPDIFRNSLPDNAQYARRIAVLAA